ncbi:MAG: sensor histidine kinase [Firmicutes bacterium]|jgi:two-component system sensor histidine kinase DegS|nr:sensor histidine kinase [Bacillota bacterium]
MSSIKFDINGIINKTVTAIEEGKNEIFEISEKARDEKKTIESQYESVRQELKNVIAEVDRLEIKEKASRKRLLEVSKNIKKYSESDIKLAYDMAKDLQIELSVKRMEEETLFKKRKELEIRIRNNKDVIERAINLTSKIGIALDFLTNVNYEKLNDMEQKSNLAVKIIQAQEKERQRVSREIHDGPAQVMANVVIKADYCHKLLDVDREKAKEELGSLKSVVRNSLRDIRKIIYDLLPMSLNDLGLVPTIQRLLSDVESNYGVKTTFYDDNLDSVYLSKIKQLTIFRIVQETANNMVKYSEAKNFVVNIVANNGEILMSIFDDGIGFDIDKLGDNKDINSGFGIYSIIERVELLKGNIDIVSGECKGTKINIVMPVDEEGENYE